MIRTVAVAGAGTMGAGIAQVAAVRGFSTFLYDLTEELVEKGKARIGEFLDRGVKGGKIPSADAEAALRNLRGTAALEDLRSADVVIEAVFEDLTVKRDLFSRLDQICPSPVLLATNTSSLSITEIGAGTSRPEKVVGMHFFNPAPIMTLVEVVRGHRTSEETVERITDLARRFGKVPVTTKDTPGFIVNRVARPFYVEALRILEEGGATAAQIDALLTGIGRFRMGPCELMDLIGNDVNFSVTRSLFEASFGNPRYTPSLTQQMLVRAGALGRKTGRGFYTYGETKGGT